MSDLKVGLVTGREWSFPPRFIEEVNRRNAGVTAELVKLGGNRMDEPSEYRVIVDRISHEVPYYRTYLKHAALQGATVVNNPFMWTADDKFFEAGLATKLGVASPKTVVLPNKEYVPGIVHDESLRNLVYPLPWQDIIDYVGMPCVLKDAHGGGWKEVYICRSPEELIANYNTSGLLTMVVQEFIEWEHFVRCVALGQNEVLPMKYDPRERRYHVEHDHLSPELGTRVVEDSLTLMRALGYDMCSLEWAVKDGVPYAIDFMNPAPDMDVNSLTPHYFEWVVTHMADLVIRLAHEAPLQPDLRRGEFLIGRREGTAAARAGAGAAAETAVAEAMSGSAPSAGWRPAEGGAAPTADSLGATLGRALDEAFGGTSAALADTPAATPDVVRAADTAPARAPRKAAAPARRSGKKGGGAAAPEAPSDGQGG